MAILFVKMSQFLGMVSESWKMALEKITCGGFGGYNVLEKTG